MPKIGDDGVFSDLRFSAVQSGSGHKYVITFKQKDNRIAFLTLFLYPAFESDCNKKRLIVVNSPVATAMPLATLRTVL
jgi:hypothetical protein